MKIFQDFSTPNFLLKTAAVLLSACRQKNFMKNMQFNVIWIKWDNMNIAVHLHEWNSTNSLKFKVFGDKVTPHFLLKGLRHMWKTKDFAASASQISCPLQRLCVSSKVHETSIFTKFFQVQTSRNKQHSHRFLQMVSHEFWGVKLIKPDMSASIQMCSYPHLIGPKITNNHYTVLCGGMVHFMNSFKMQKCVNITTYCSSIISMTNQSEFPFNLAFKINPRHESMNCIENPNRFSGFRDEKLFWLRYVEFFVLICMADEVMSLPNFL